MTPEILEPHRSWRHLIFSPRGRIDRRSFVFWVPLFQTIILLLIYASVVLLFEAARWMRGHDGLGTAWVVAPAVLLLGLGGTLLWSDLVAIAKRLRDRNRPGWLCLVALIPIAGLWIWVETALLRGTNGPNRYGDAPARFGFRRHPGERDGWTAIAVDFLIYLVMFGAMLAVAWMGRHWVAEPFSIPSASNQPTIIPGDDIGVAKYAYGFGLGWGQNSVTLPQRGDMVALRSPVNPRIVFVKRVIGLPGDHVQLIRGQLYLNDAAVGRQQVADFAEADTGEFHHQFIETLPGGRQYRILQDDDDGPVDNTELYIVPPNHLFVLGDNRDNSRDSRFLRDFGYVPVGNLIGRVEIRYFSVDPEIPWWAIRQWPAAIRWNRLFTVVQ